MTMFDRRQLLQGTAAALAAALIPRRSIAADRPMVLVITSSSTDATTAMVDAYGQDMGSATRMTYDLGGDESAVAFIADNIRDIELALVFAIGDVAARAASREFATIPLVYADAADAVPRSRQDTAQVTTLVDPAHALDHLQRIVPTARRLGVIAAAGQGAAYVQQFEVAADAAGVEVTVQQPTNAADLSNALKALLLRSDVIWIQDNPLWTGSALASAFTDARQARIPLVSFSTAHFASPTPPPLVMAASPSAIGHAAARASRQLLGMDQEATASLAEPEVWGDRAAMRASGLMLNKKQAAAVDAWYEG